MLTRLCFCLISFCSLSVGYSQKLVFENISVRKGRAFEIYSLIQDMRAYIWVFTGCGSVNDNNSSFVPICTNLPLKESALYVVTESLDDHLYVDNLKGGGDRIDDHQVYRVPVNEKLNNAVQDRGEAIIQLVIVNKNDLSVTVQLNCYRFPRETKQVVQRLESLNQLYQTKGGKIEFFDLMDANGEPCGLRVNILIPKEILNELYDEKNKRSSR